MRARAEAAILGLAIGDALGMPAQGFAPAEIARRFGRIADFLPAPDDNPISRGLGAGMVTDDTEQALLLARRLLAGPWDERAWARDLLEWEAGMRARGLAELLGPSTRRALEALMAGGDPARTGLAGDTNGAAMRIAPLGIACPPGPGLIDRVVATSRVTHATAPALGAAAAVAAAISAAIAGADWRAALAEGLSAAEAAAARGAWVAGAEIAARIRLALEIAEPGRLAAAIGTGVLATESVATALGLVAAARGDPWQAALMAANIGGDTDTIGAIAGSVAAASGGALPPRAVETVTRVNGLRPGPLVEGLLAMRGTACA
ncbi:MAG: ADP-ribosylglycohydrolase [Paracoccaceae bacterium]|nr:MAG: ADP-ribosylglycohydrolase [Paracoccaceae bacterium]